MGQRGRFATATSPGCWRKGYRWVLIVCLLVPMCALASEAALRVAFVYNFLKFIEWPDSSTDHFDLCVLGAQGDMREALDQLATRSLNKRPIHLTYIEDNKTLAAGLSDCQLVYWPASTRRFAVPESLSEGVVLVTDEGSAQLPQVSIGLHRTPDGRIEFTVNQAAVEHAGVRISSQLLKLAKNYHEDARPPQGGVND